MKRPQGGPRKGPNEVLTAKVDFLSGDPCPRVRSGAYNDEVNVLVRFNRHYRLLATGLVAPLVVCLIVLPFRDSVPNTSAALLLVLVIVGVDSAGDRLAGLLAALSAGLGVDFFLPPPYESLAIFSAANVQTTLLLLGVGVAVTEIAYRGREQQAMASKRLRSEERRV